MWADIMARVCGCQEQALQSEPARLRGHRRHPVAGEDYPGLVPDEDGDAVDGVLYRGLGPSEWQRLDAFEGSDYERVLVSVEAGARTEFAWVYRFRAEHADRLVPGPWDPLRFAREGKARFLARYGGFSATP